MTTITETRLPSPGVVREEVRGSEVHSPWRDRPVEESLKEFEVCL